MTLFRMFSHHFHSLFIDRFSKHASISSDVVDHLIERRAFHLFVFEIGERVVGEVEHNAALSQLLYEELLALLRVVGFCAGERVNMFVS